MKQVAVRLVSHFGSPCEGGGFSVNHADADAKNNHACVLPADMTDTDAGFGNSWQPLHADSQLCPSSQIIGPFGAWVFAP